MTYDHPNLRALRAVLAKRKQDDPLADLIEQFAAALLAKARAAEIKYGHNDSWLNEDWADYLRRYIREHVEKGDPLDVAIYAAFAWHHKWSLAAPVLHDRCCSAISPCAHQRGGPCNRR